MITNEIVTYYKKELDDNKLDIWKKYIFKKAWVFGGKDITINTGYENNNKVSVRIPMEIVNDKKIFNVGDIIAIGEQNNIEKQSDLKDVEFYNVTSIRINNFGNNPHIHLEGK